MDTDPFAHLDPAHGRRPELARLIRSSGRRSNEQSSAQVDAAMNLVSKAADRRARGDLERAEHLVGLAARLPYDDWDESSPGIRGACQEVYNLVSDVFEDSDWEDLEWLEVALEVHATLQGPGRAELASTLNGFVLQGDLFELSREETRRITAAVGDAPLEADLGDEETLSVDARAAVISSLVDALAALRAAYRDRGWA